MRASYPGPFDLPPIYKKGGGSMNTSDRLATQRAKAAEYRKNPEYVAMFRRAASYFAAIDRAATYTRK